MGRRTTLSTCLPRDAAPTSAHNADEPPRRLRRSRSHGGGHLCDQLRRLSEDVARTQDEDRPSECTQPVTPSVVVTPLLPVQCSSYSTATFTAGYARSSRPTWQPSASRTTYCATGRGSPPSISTSRVRVSITDSVSG